MATGCSFRDLAFNYRLGESTVGKIIEETCDAIWLKMQPIEMPEPTESFWLQKAEEFKDKWQFPHCLSAIDGKHVVIQKPTKSGSSFFNYKKTFSIVLMAGVDASYKFTFIDVGSMGRFSDGSIFSNSNFGKRFNDNKLNIPKNDFISNNFPTFPYVFVGDEAFPLSKHLMRPYPGCYTKNDINCRIFNYRLSRARQSAECAFGILVARFRVFKKPFEANLRKVNKIVKATCVLHNYLCGKTSYEEIIETLDVHDFEDAENQLLDTHRSRVRSTREAFQIRKAFTEYFMSPEGSVTWQLNAISKGKY